MCVDWILTTIFLPILLHVEQRYCNNYWVSIDATSSNYYGVREIEILEVNTSNPVNSMIPIKGELFDNVNCTNHSQLGQELCIHHSQLGQELCIHHSQLGQELCIHHSQLGQELCIHHSQLGQELCIHHSQQDRSWIAMS